MRNSFSASTAATAVLASGLLGQPALGNQPTGTFNPLGTVSPSGSPACASSNPFPGSASTFPFLLTDGTVMVQDQSGTAQNWYRLTPDNTGSYSCGTWTKLASIPNSFGYGPDFYASAVLPDGRLGIAGGEYNQGGPQSEIAKAAIYLPTTNQWLPIRPPAGWTQIGDAESVVLPNGKWMIGNVGTQQALLNENNLTFTPTGYGLKICTNNEAGWTLLPDGSLFSVDNNISCGTSPSAERWVNGTWFPASSTGNVPQQLFDANGAEMGPQILMNNGNVLAIGATGNVSVYTPPPVQTPPSFATGSWANTTTLPVLCGTSSTTQCASTDSPASMLPNGRPLLVACPVANTSVMPANEFPAGNRFFEYDTSVNPAAWNQPTYPGALKTQLNSDSCGFLARMLLLPNGQAMYVNGSKSVWFYNPAGPAPQPSWQPTITTYPATINRNTTYIISGLLFNGMSQGNFFGDDVQNSTNYPIVQATINGSGHVYYGRTHNHSSMGVAQTTLPVTTQFELWDCNPPHVVAGSACVPESGAATLVVIANGIASAPVNVTIN